MNLETFFEVNETLLGGFGFNLALFGLTLLFALPLGLIFCYLRMGRLKVIMQAIIWALRGSPLMIQLFIVMYVPGILFNFPIKERFTVAVIAFSINYAAYFCEIFRGGIESMPRGQFEAGRVLGLSNWKIQTKIILPQVIKRIVPPLGNEFIILVKDTTLARVIAVPEMLMVSTEFSTRGMIWPLFYTAVFFLIATAILTLLLKFTEKRFAYYEG